MFRRPLAVAALFSVMAVTIAACSSDETAQPPDTSESAAPTSPSEGVPEAPLPVTTKVAIGTVTGDLAAEKRTKLKTRVATAINGWLDAAYVAGDYPRRDFSDAFTTFSVGAERRAKRDAALMSNAAIGAQIDSVEVLQRSLRIDVLAVKGQAAGVTVALVLGLQLDGEIERKDRITGNVYMTYRNGRWQVFGYDVQRAVA